MSGKVAPHLSNEVRLVMGGIKPLAAIEKSKDPYGYALAFAVAGTGALSLKLIGEGEVIITKPNKPLIEHYEELLRNGVRDLGIKATTGRWVGSLDTLRQT
tara:strand:+ start:2217 stop:2519 length:303 start_codon:yes stop_codon:yes gene_type:complete